MTLVAGGTATQPATPTIMPPRRAFQQSAQLFGTTWELGDGSKDRAKSTANLNGHKCVVQLNCPDSGWRRFGSYATWDACRAATQVLQGDRRHLFEVISHDKPCKPYLDIDSETLPAPYEDVQQLVDHLQGLVTRVFKEDYLIDLEADAFQWLHSPNPNKMSLHLVISTHSPQLVFRSNHFADPQGAAHLARRLAELDPECAGKIVDQAVYTRDREMRVCGASKFGKNSVLQPLRALTLEEMTSEPPLAPDDSLITALDAHTALIGVPETVPLIVRKAKRLPRVYKEIMQDADQADLPFASSRMLELLQARLHPTAYRERPFSSEDPATGVRFSYTNRSEPCYTGSVHGPTMNLACTVDIAGDVHAKCFSPLCTHALPHRLGKLHAEPELFRAHAVTIDTPFLSPKADEADDRVVSQDASLDTILRAWIDHPDKQGSTKAVSIRSPMGTGKTTMLDRVLTRLRETVAASAAIGGGKPEGTNVLVLTYRQTLAYEQLRKLQHHGFVNYLDVPKDAPLHSRKKYPRVICQIESLRRVAGPSGLAGLHAQFDLVIIDEVESVLRHFCSPTVGSPYSTLEFLIEIITGARRVVALDAFLGDATHDFLKKIGVSNRVVVNTHQAPPRTFRFTNHQAGWLARIVQDLADDKNIVMASLSTQLIYKVIAPHRSSDLARSFAVALLSTIC